MKAKFQVTVRYGSRNLRYLTLFVESVDAVHALRSAADKIPLEIAPEVDLVELRKAPTPPEEAGSPPPRPGLS